MGAPRGGGRAPGIPDRAVLALFDAAQRFRVSNRVYGISWNFWPWKKLGTSSSPLSGPVPAGWSSVVEYSTGQGHRPSRAEAQAAFGEYLDGLAVDRCVYRAEIIHALFRRAPLTIAPEAFGSAVAAVPLGSRSTALRAEAPVRLVARRPTDSGIYDYRDGEPNEGRFELFLEAGDHVTYTVGLEDASGVVVTVDADGPVEIRIDGAPVQVLPTDAGLCAVAEAGPGSLHIELIGSTEGAAVVRAIRVEPH